MYLRRDGLGRRKADPRPRSRRPRRDALATGPRRGESRKTALVVHRDAQTDAASAKEALYVVFKVGGAEYALQAETVIQLESFTGCTRVPGTSAFVAGLVQIRGRVMPVVDLRVRFGVDAAPASLDTRVVVGQRGERIVALLVDSAGDVVKIAPSSVVAPTRVLDNAAARFVEEIAQLGPRMILLVDFAKVIGEEHVDVV